MTLLPDHDCARSPSAVAVGETRAFVREHLPPPPARLLDVGGGDGELAAQLIDDGYEVTVVDPAESAHGGCSRRSVPIEPVSWLDRDTPSRDVDRVDAILFVRSLHHLSPLDLAVERAAATTRDGGVVIVEDFAFQSAESSLIEWCGQHARRLRADGRFEPAPGTLLDSILDAGDPEEAWRAWGDDVHGIHPEATMRGALDRPFEFGHDGVAPYAYRYFIPGLPKTRDGVATVLELLGDERASIDEGRFAPLGRRWVMCTPKVTDARATLR